LTQAKQLHSQMVNSYESDQKNLEKQRSGELTLPELEERKELLNLFKQDLDYTESELRPKKFYGEGFEIARSNRARRK